MTSLSISTSLSSGAIVGAQIAVPSGPIRTATAAVTGLNPEVGQTVSRTLGSYTPRGGGVVTILLSEWRVDGFLVGNGPTYKTTLGDLGSALTYVEQATETGGTADGATDISIVTGGVVAAASGPAPEINTFTVSQNAIGAAVDVDIVFGPTVSLPVTCFIVGVPVGDPAPTPAQIVNGYSSHSTPAAAAATFQASSAGTTSVAISEMTTGSYDFYAVISDAQNVLSAVVTETTIPLSF